MCVQFNLHIHFSLHSAKISKEDIEKSYGGSLGTRTFYSSAYSSSTNAYMLMYRQIDPHRNVSAIKREQFPDHIKVNENWNKFWKFKKIQQYFFFDKFPFLAIANNVERRKWTENKKYGL